MRIILFFLLVPSFLFTQNEIFFITKGQNALQKQNYAAYLTNFKRATKLADHHPWVQFQLARAYLLNKKEKDAIKTLNRLVKMQAGFDFSTDSLFNTLSNHSKYMVIHTQLKKNLEAQTNSELAFQTKDKFLVPEGICHDEVKDVFYFGSIHKRKILEINSTGEVSDFCAPKANGLWGVLGMKVDPIRRHLWVCSAVGAAVDSLNGNSGIFKYDLDTKQFIQSYWLKKEGNTKHLFNDLVITKNGDLYFTDSEAGAIYTIPIHSNKIERFISSDLLSYPNGIALNPKGDAIFVSTVGKLYRINLINKKMTAVKKSKHLFIGGFDGLYWHQDGLIGIQNGFRPTRIVKLKLNKRQNKVIALEELERNALHYNVPTTGVIANNHFYYISNSYINHYQPKKKLKVEDFGPAKIYKISLSH